MFELLRKTFTINILGKDIKYKQLSYYDCLELHYEITQPGFNIVHFVFEFLQKHIEIKEADLLQIDVKKFFETYLDTACRGFYDKKKGSGEPYPFEAFISFVAKEMGLDPITMLKRYTPEAFNFILQGIIYNINEQTKEGRKKNKIQSIRKDNQKEVTTDDDMEKIRKAREKYKELFNQKNG